MQFIFQFCQPICGNSEHWYKHNTISYLHPHVEIRPEKKMYIGLSISLDLYICRVFFRMHNEKKQKKIHTNTDKTWGSIYDIWGKQHIIFFYLKPKAKLRTPLFTSADLFYMQFESATKNGPIYGRWAEAFALETCFSS